MFKTARLEGAGVPAPDSPLNLTLLFGESCTMSEHDMLADYINLLPSRVLFLRLSCA